MLCVQQLPLFFKHSCINNHQYLPTTRPLNVRIKMKIHESVCTFFNISRHILLSLKTQHFKFYKTANTFILNVLDMLEPECAGEDVHC